MLGRLLELALEDFAGAAMVTEGLPMSSCCCWGRVDDDMVG